MVAAARSPNIALFGLALRVLVLLNLVDTVCTLHWCLSGLACEANPLMRWALNLGPAAFITSKVCMVLVGVGVLWRARFHALARAGVIPLLLAYTWVAQTHAAEAVRLLAL